MLPISDPLFILQPNIDIMFDFFYMNMSYIINLSFVLSFSCLLTDMDILVPTKVFVFFTLCTKKMPFLIVLPNIPIIDFYELYFFQFINENLLHCRFFFLCILQILLINFKVFLFCVIRHHRLDHILLRWLSILLY